MSKKEMMDNNLDNFDGFTINLYLDEQQEWLAHFVEMPHISAFDDTPQQALEELRIAWELVKEDYQIKREEIPEISKKEQEDGQLNFNFEKR